MENLTVSVSFITGTALLASAYYFKPTNYESCWETNKAALIGLSNPAMSKSLYKILTETCKATQ
ncbi:hypothetical protein PsAD2_02991 [Pseudovibrio axinellae]|uniref:Uncharacterized protein n=1 Tax=Pseudovibrio axinellae TaxID=989403 RepID=A0A165XFE0_9HYPH|nr:hypothetical protein PsAD2_02991 [Pseudovibrio axinellae]SER44793.1 hypothetical protein SAMN05421798_11091 [Pseudovibrio axinellae]